MVVFEIGTIDGVGSAFFAGLLTGTHCAGMCGPLGCLILCRCKNAEDSLHSQVLYHSSRLFSYTLVCALAGGVSGSLKGFPLDEMLFAIPLLMVLMVLLSVLRIDGPLKLLNLPLKAIQGKLSRVPAPVASGLLGFLTPALPCAPLYLMVTASLFSGGAVKGGALGAAFCCGTMPLLVLSHWGWMKAGKHLHPQTLNRLKLALLSAALIIVLWRTLNGDNARQGLCL